MASSRKKKEQVVTVDGPVSEYQKGEIVKIHRSQLKNASYNPRKIDAKAKKKLKENIERVGLLDHPIWNSRTGNLVTHHQRLVALDSLHGTQDYFLTVNKVDLDEKTEKEQNIFMNNPRAQGEFDWGLMESMFTEGDLTSENTGFDLADTYRMFGDVPFALSPMEQTEMQDAVKKMKDIVTKYEEKYEDRDDPNSFLIFVFRSHRSRLDLTGPMSWEDNTWQNGEELKEVLNAKRNTNKKETGAESEKRPASGRSRRSSGSTATRASSREETSEGSKDKRGK